MKSVQCKNCKHFIRNIFYKNEGICSNNGRFTREHYVCNLLDTDEKKQDAKIKAVSSSVCPNCKLPFTKDELQPKEHCFNCGKTKYYE